MERRKKPLWSHFYRHFVSSGLEVRRSCGRSERIRGFISRFSRSQGNNGYFRVPCHDLSPLTGTSSPHWRILTGSESPSVWWSFLDPPSSTRFPKGPRLGRFSWVIFQWLVCMIRSQSTSWVPGLVRSIVFRLQSRDPVSYLDSRNRDGGTLVYSR